MKLIMKRLFIVYAVIIFFAAFAIQFTGWFSWRMDGPSQGPIEGLAFGFPIFLFHAPIEIEENTGDTPIPHPLSFRLFSTGSSYINPGEKYFSNGLFIWEQKKWDRPRWLSSYKIVSAFIMINIDIPEEIDPSFTSRVPGVIANISYVILILICLLYLRYSGMIRRHDVLWAVFFIFAGPWVILLFIACVIGFINGFNDINGFFELLRYINVAGMWMIYFCILDWLYLAVKYLFLRLFFRKSQVHGLETSSQ